MKKNRFIVILSVFTFCSSAPLWAASGVAERDLGSVKPASGVNSQPVAVPQTPQVKTASQADASADKAKSEFSDGFKSVGNGFAHGAKVTGNSFKKAGLATGGFFKKIGSGIKGIFVKDKSQGNVAEKNLSQPVAVKTQSGNDLDSVGNSTKGQAKLAPLQAQEGSANQGANANF